MKNFHEKLIKDVNFLSNEMCFKLVLKMFTFSEKRQLYPTWKLVLVAKSGKTLKHVAKLHDFKVD